MSTAANYSPDFDVEVNFTPDIQNNNKAIGLFDSVHSNVSASTIPLDALIYGDNGNGYLDATGAVPSTGQVDNPGSGDSLERTASGWVVQVILRRVYAPCSEEQVWQF